jgi:delta11-fatty-acid desaturase
MDTNLCKQIDNDVIKDHEEPSFNSSLNPFNDRLITKIHNKYYDLSKFSHPGGPIAISLIVNRDGTELFESHHLYSTKDIDQILSKYELLTPPKVEINPSNIYNWELTKSSEFTKELKAMARQEIGKDIKCSWPRLIELLIIFFVALTQIVQFYQGYWHSLLLMPLTYWVLGVNTFHDASHFGLSWNWKINRLGTNLGFCFSAPYTWYHQHIIGHHCFPNIHGKDPDLYHAPKIIRHSPDVKHRVAHLYQTITFVFTWLLGVPLSILWHGMIQSYRRPAYNRVVKFANTKYLNPKSLITRFIIYFTLFHITPFIFLGATIKAVIFSIVPIYLFSLFFMVSTQINHLTPDTVDQLDENFFIHQIKTSHNVATDNYLLFLFTGGLNMQIEHHLFPSMNHCHLKKIMPKVKQLCQKYGVKYSESQSLWQALCLHVAHLRKYSVKE